MKKIIPTLLCIALVSATVPAHAGKGNRLTARLAKVLGFTAHRGSLPRLFLTTALACTALACGTIKPHLYTVGILNPSSAMQAESTAAAVLAVQRNYDGQGNIISNHIYAIKPYEHKAILAEIVAVDGSIITLQGYADKYPLTIAPETISARLIDDHANVGRHVKLASDAVGISHFNGEVFAVYSNGIHAIRITSKTSVDGVRQKLHGKDDAPHVRFAYEHQLY